MYATSDCFPKGSRLASPSLSRSSSQFRRTNECLIIEEDKRIFYSKMKRLMVKLNPEKRKIYLN